LRRLILTVSVVVPALVGAQQPAAADSAAWTIGPMPQASLVLARDGSLIGEIGKEIRTSVAIKSLSKYLPQAFVAVEDHRFYQHDGVDVVGIAGALKDNIFGERRGASTITQQLVGNMHPTLIDRTDRSLGRKLNEQAAAREMEKHYSKDQILEAYLNQIPFGHGWYGVESAARHYFGKSASKLTLAEAASLAAMPKGPALYDPLKYPDRVRQRRNVVMVPNLPAPDGATAQAYQLQARNLARLAKEGMTIAVGTDGNTPAGPHQEMADMVTAGMTPAQVLVAGTKTGADFLRINAGAITQGKSADFLVLDANPLDDIRNTTKINAVYLRGAAVDRSKAPATQ
jgi:membrane carboxypeptidase/penicillin-binding protein